MVCLVNHSGVASVLSRLYCGIQSYPDVPVQGAVRRKWHVLFKDCNAVLEHLCSSLWAGREGVVRGVAPLGKGAPLPAKARLAGNRFTTR
jgi:hypothetical protein